MQPGLGERPLTTGARGGSSALHAADARHLSADAEFAEDLAIRYADTHHGLRTPYYVSGEDYAAARERCLGTLFERVAQEHGVPAVQVSSALGRNRALIDVAENLPSYCSIAPLRPSWQGWCGAAIRRPRSAGFPAWL